jgi:hypothetical protein
VVLCYIGCITGSADTVATKLTRGAHGTCTSVCTSRPVLTGGAGYTIVGGRAPRAVPVHCHVGCIAVSADTTDNTKLARCTRGAVSEEICTKGKVLIPGTGYTSVGGSALRAISVHWYGGCCTVSADATDTKLASGTGGALSGVCCTCRPVLTNGTGHPIAGGSALRAILVYCYVSCYTGSAGAIVTKLACRTHGACGCGS